ncbi:N-formylglutamate deformylase [Chachezhania antarctica]|uniref:N-formylglutamate deformylase n=1 Tax=Chachezhania antarctica TaxID=2340860 RepID=UPI000EAF4C59|nr:N-formylglutamate deformylase [Chachezhania antarctica]|tara:strand:+ start:2835 stop:3653 length:819 start_codon:yes stop_codon:yes gene_type:complete
MTPVEITRGVGPIVLGMPHTGTFVPPEVMEMLNDTGRELANTDWHVDQLYDGLLADATVVRATFHRYVIDANRDPSGASLYPGQNTTGLVPLTDFDGAPLWQTEPDAAEIERRRLAYHAPYHAALQAELERVRAKHGVAILWDCHSIRSVIPYLFDGTLPDFNIGTNNGETCAPVLEEAVAKVCAEAPQTSVLNGRFRGGWTTRHYGQPANGLHAIQMEMAYTTYLAAEEPPWTYDPTRAAPARAVLADALTALESLAPTLAQTHSQEGPNA